MLSVARFEVDTPAVTLPIFIPLLNVDGVNENINETIYTMTLAKTGTGATAGKLIDGISQNVLWSPEDQTAITPLNPTSSTPKQITEMNLVGPQVTTDGLTYPNQPQATDQYLTADPNIWLGTDVSANEPTMAAPLTEFALGSINSIANTVMLSWGAGYCLFDFGANSMTIYGIRTPFPYDLTGWKLNLGKSTSNFPNDVLSRYPVDNQVITEVFINPVAYESNAADIILVFANTSWTGVGTYVYNVASTGTNVGLMRFTSPANTISVLPTGTTITQNLPPIINQQPNYLLNQQYELPCPNSCVGGSGVVSQNGTMTASYQVIGPFPLTSMDFLPSPAPWDIAENALAGNTLTNTAAMGKGQFIYNNANIIPTATNNVAKKTLILTISGIRQNYQGQELSITNPLKNSTVQIVQQNNAGVVNSSVVDAASVVINSIGSSYQWVLTLTLATGIPIIGFPGTQTALVSCDFINVTGPFLSTTVPVTGNDAMSGDSPANSGNVYTTPVSLQFNSPMAYATVTTSTDAIWEVVFPVNIGGLPIPQVNQWSNTFTATINFDYNAIITAGQDLSTGYYNCYSTRWWLACLNRTLNALWVQAGQLATKSPFLTIDAGTNLISLLTPEGAGLNFAVDEMNATGIGSPYPIFIGAPAGAAPQTTDVNWCLFFNEPLFNLLSGFNSVYYGNTFLQKYPTFCGDAQTTTLATTKPFLFNYYVQPINYQNINLANIPTATVANITPVPYYITTSEYSPVPMWNPIQSLVFTSSLLPIVLSYATAQLPFNTGQSPQTAYQSTGQNSQITNMLSDIQVGLVTGSEYKPSVLYVPQGEYRLIDLNGSMPINSASFAVQYKTKYNQIIPFKLGAQCGANIKILFRRKRFNLGNLPPYDTN
jgi:hypothetical protein